MLPDDCCTVKLPAPIFNSVPSNVKFASSSIAPAVPASTTLLSVRSLIVALVTVVSPASNAPALTAPVAVVTSNAVPT